MRLYLEGPYLDGEFELEWCKYLNGKNQLILVDSIGRSYEISSNHLLKSTKADEIIVKVGGEYCGLLSGLVDAGILEPLEDMITLGQALWLCKIVINVKFELGCPVEPAEREPSPWEVL